ncbi:ABC transporter substrate-binding protein [Vogesella sp. LIG4]|uniref:substrate-binding periplasmic protein n=1 Tax=Vogesella sp. LIG4 TaxID=1192162 RepID=UPI0012FE037E|nr:transporter substrate-binding domain-containing protein [Vogesella sp. LIG4]
MRIISLIASLLWAGQLAARPLLLLTQQQAPYAMQQPDGRQYGLALQAVRCALQRSGQSVVIRFVSWSRAQRLVESGAADGYFPASRNPQRDVHAQWFGPAAPQEWRWYLRRDNPLDPAAPDFAQRARVGAYAGSNMQQWLLDHGYRISVSPPEHDQILDVLLAGRADAVVAANLAMEALIAKRGVASRVRSVLLQDKPLGLYLAHDYVRQQPQLVASLPQAMRQCYPGR